MKRVSQILCSVLFIAGCLKCEVLSAAQQLSKQTAAQSPAQPVSRVRTSAEPVTVMPATVAKVQDRETIANNPMTEIIPAGSVITVRLVNPPDSNSKPGDGFDAIVTGLIAVGGAVVVPSGAAVRGKITGVKAQKKATDKARLKLALTGLTIDGTPYRIQTKLIEIKAQRKDSKGTTANTVEAAGVPARSDLVFKLTAPVTVNRLRRSGSAGRASRKPAATSIYT